MLAVAIIFLLFPIINSTLTTDKITATDWVYRHSVWIDQYLTGDFSAIQSYPPLFHWLMLPFVAINFPIKYFQIIFAVLSISSILYFVYKKENEKAVIYSAVLLAGSIAFVEFSGSLMPQALDYILFPLAILLYYRKHTKSMIAVLLIMMLMHGTGFLFVFVLLAHALLTKYKKMIKTLIILLLLLLPIFYYYQFYAVQTFEQNTIMSEIHNIDAQNEWDAQYYNPLWKFFGMSGFLTWILLFPAIYKVIKKRFKLTDTQILYIIWVAVFLPFPFFSMGFWRMVSYQIVPLSLLVASLLSEEKVNKK